jgi:hypothetical protein
MTWWDTRTIRTSNRTGNRTGTVTGLRGVAWCLCIRSLLCTLPLTFNLGRGAKSVAAFGLLPSPAVKRPLLLGRVAGRKEQKKPCSTNPVRVMTSNSVTKMFVLDAFGKRQFNNEDYTGTKASSLLL